MRYFFLVKLRYENVHLTSNKMKKQKTRILCKALIKNNKGEVLLLKRKDNKEWELPGGLLEFGEDPYTCIEREVKEETSLKVKVIRPIKILSHTYEKENKIVHVITIIFSCKLLDKNKEIKLDTDEHSEWKWKIYRL